MSTSPQQTLIVEDDRTGLHVETLKRMLILNTARSGKFSSDTSIQDYSRLVWKMEKVRSAMHGE